MTRPTDRSYLSIGIADALGPRFVLDARKKVTMEGETVEGSWRLRRVPFRDFVLLTHHECSFTLDCHYYLYLCVLILINWILFRHPMDTLNLINVKSSIVRSNLHLHMKKWELWLQSAWLHQRLPIDHLISLRLTISFLIYARWAGT